MSEKLQQRTSDEIADLKAQWEGDPHWDLEETEGFEAHKAELLAHRKACTARWQKEEKQRLASKAEKLNCSVELAKHIDVLETRLARMEAKIYE